MEQTVGHDLEQGVLCVGLVCVVVVVEETSQRQVLSLVLGQGFWLVLGFGGDGVAGGGVGGT